MLEHTHAYIHNICMYLCMYIYIYMYIYVCIYIYIYITSSFRDSSSYIHIHTCTTYLLFPRFILIHTHKHAYAHTCIHTYLLFPRFILCIKRAIFAAKFLLQCCNLFMCMYTYAYAYLS